MIPIHRIVGMIESDPDRVDVEPMPLLVIEGQPSRWVELGSVLMSYEGFKFRLDIIDPSEEL